MGDHRLHKRVMSRELENAGKRGPGGKEKEWTECAVEDLRLFGITTEGRWRNPARPSFCVTPVGCVHKSDAQNKCDENTHTHTHGWIQQTLEQY